MFTKNSNNVDNNLSWEKELEEVYNFISWTILAHNIWYRPDYHPDVEDYKRFKMKHLILKRGQYKVKMTKHPFLYLFCLVDTIEPTKKKEISFQDVDNIELNIERKLIKVSLRQSAPAFYKFLDDCQVLNEWLSPTTRNGNEVTITI